MLIEHMVVSTVVFVGMHGWPVRVMATRQAERINMAMLIAFAIHMIPLTSVVSLLP